jgi:hypothetical protein
VELGGKDKNDGGKECALAQPLDANGSHGEKLLSQVWSFLAYRKRKTNKITNFKRLYHARIEGSVKNRGIAVLRLNLWAGVIQ